MIVQANSECWIPRGNGSFQNTKQLSELFVEGHVSAEHLVWYITHIWRTSDMKTKVGETEVEIKPLQNNNSETGLSQWIRSQSYKHLLKVSHAWQRISC